MYNAAFDRKLIKITSKNIGHMHVYYVSRLLYCCVHEKLKNNDPIPWLT